MRRFRQFVASTVRRRRVLVASLVLASCTKPSPTTEAPIKADDAAVLTSPPPTATPTAMPTAEDDGPDAGAGDVFCAKDADCDWDDPCMAKRCIAAPKKGFVGC